MIEPVNAADRPKIGPPADFFVGITKLNKK